MKAIITEKPNVAREIAKVLQVRNRKDGYLYGNGYCITWTSGPLTELEMPEAYGIPNVDPSVLPITPKPFRLVPRTQNSTKGSRPDPLVIQQLNVIRELFRACNRIIVATDADREGELMFRYIYQYLQCTKPFDRLWISSLTEKAISDGLKNLQPGNTYDPLYDTAKARTEADWLVGINASRALTVATGQTYLLGRVETPTLALICQRYEEHRQFKKETYYRIQLQHRKDYLDFTSVSTEQWQDRKQVEKIRASVEREGRAVVEEVQTRTVKEPPPLLYDLSTLQIDANRKLGLTALETLQMAQSLYEKQFITYPKTESSYIPEYLWPDIPELVRVLKNDQQFKQAISHVKFGSFNKHIVNNVKATNHYGLLITHKLPSALSASEKAVYNMIAYRLLESLSEPCIKETNHILLKVHHYGFQIKASTLRSPGWRSIRGFLSDDHSDPNEGPLVELPVFNNGDLLKISNTKILQKTNQPPSLYTEADLLSAMEHAGSLTHNQDQKEILHNTGIGTPATRGSIIEILIKHHYIIRKNSALQPTDNGLNVYNLTKDQLISNLKIPTGWELALQRIEQNELAPDQFIQDITSYTTEITKELLSLKMQSEEVPNLQCPKCKVHQLIITDKIIKCPDEQCQWNLYRIICGVKLTHSDIAALITTSLSPLIKNMKAKNGKKIDAFIVLKEDHKTALEFP